MLGGLRKRMIIAVPENKNPPQRVVEEMAKHRQSHEILKIRRDAAAAPLMIRRGAMIPPNGSV